MGHLPFSLQKKRLGVLGAIILPGKRREDFHLTDVALLLWQVLLLPDLVTAWDKGIYGPPSCLWIISVSIVSWTVMGYKQSKLTERTWRDLALGNYLAIITSFVECGGICAFGQHLLFLKGVYHVVEVMAFWLYTQMGNYHSKYHTATGRFTLTEWALCLEGFFLSVKEIWISTLVVIIKFLLF